MRVNGHFLCQLIESNAAFLTEYEYSSANSIESLQQKEAGTQLYPFIVLAIFHWGKSLCFSKDLGEVAEGGEA